MPPESIEKQEKHRKQQTLKKKQKTKNPTVVKVGGGRSRGGRMQSEPALVRNWPFLEGVLLAARDSYGMQITTFLGFCCCLCGNSDATHLLD